MEVDVYEYSGQMLVLDNKLTNEYCPYIKFDFVTYYPLSVGRWEEHYLGEKDGKFYILELKHQTRVE